MGVLKTMYTIGEILRNRAEYSPDLEAVVGTDARYTYREFNQRVNQTAHFMLELGIRKGDRVALLCTTNHPFAIVWMAAAKVGAIAVPLNWRLNSEELRGYMEHSLPRILFFEDAFADVAEEMEPLIFLERMVRVGVDNKLNPAFESALLERPDHEPGCEVRPEDPVVLTYTSGTTGPPKGVVTTHQNFFAAGTAVGMSVDIRMRDRYLATIPLFHIAGLVAITSAPLWGFTTVFMPKFHPVQVWDLVERERITQMMTLPPMLSFMLPEVMEGEWDTGSLREIFCTGSNAPEDLVKQYISLGFPVVLIYGASECTGAITFWTPEMGMDTCRSVGKSIAGEIRIVDVETGKEVPRGEVGEVVCKGPHLFSRYWKDPEATSKLMKDGWFHTEDAGRLDEDGFLYIIDRSPDVIRTRDEELYPSQVEAVLLEMEQVEEVAVVGVNDGAGEAPRAYVVKKAGSELTEDDVLQYARGRLAEHKLKDVVMTNTLPKNSRGIVLKYLLRDQADGKIPPERVTG